MPVTMNDAPPHLHAAGELAMGAPNGSGTPEVGTGHHEAPAVGMQGVPRNYWPPVLLALICLVALSLRYFRLSESWLWYDEVFGSTFAAQSLVDATIAAIRFDVHPPLWIQQLNLWSRLSLSDQWLLSNSIGWSLAAVVSLYWTAQRIYGTRVALLAALLLAIMPVSVAYARFLRMYPMLMTLTIWAWYFSFHFLTRGGRRRTLAGLVLSELALSYSHGIGVLTNVCLGLYGILLRLGGSTEPVAFRRWSRAQAVVAVLSLGGVANGFVRRVAHTFAPDWSHLTTTAASYWLGLSWVADARAGVLGLVLSAALICGIIAFRRGRTTLLALWLCPLLMTFVLSHLVRPIWHLHALMSTVPFAALGVALTLDNLSASRRRELVILTRSVACLTVTLLFAASVHHVKTFEKQTNYRWVVEEIERDAVASDVVVVPESADFWGVARYALGPDWGSPLQIQSAAPGNDRWARLLAAMGPVWRQRLHLEPLSSAVEHNGIQYVVGEDFEELIADEAPTHVLVVRSRSSYVDELRGYRTKARRQRGNIQLVVLERLPDVSADLVSRLRSAR